MNFIEIYDNALTPEMCKDIINYFEECPDDLKHKGQIYGEKRLSDFLLWEGAYAELFFTDVMWPDFRSDHLEAAINDYHRRERRYVCVSVPDSNEITNNILTKLVIITITR